MLGIIIFIVSVLLLVGGYAVYGRIAERLYGISPEFEMPCEKKSDGVDFVPLPTWKIFLIQLLNIAGLGPVVGAVSGCLFGPVALLWIVVGCIFAGALHDFMAACMSADMGGKNLPDVISQVMGKSSRYIMSIICVFLLLMVGVVFTLLPAKMLSSMMPAFAMGVTMWSVIILGYYFLATILPIQTIIGRIYPIFGALFLFMAVGLLIGLPLSGHSILPDLDIFANQHPQGLSVWPMIFVTIACGAISGFHATQSPMMVRCLRGAANLRRVFYGAMIMEGLVALIWATVGLSLRELVLPGASGASFAELTLQNPALAIHVGCEDLLGKYGAMLVVLGVVVLAVTSGDTAMRSCRLMVADLFHFEQRSVWKRLLLALPLFVTVIIISQVDFSVIWRYFGWANQTLATLTLWTICVFLRKRGKCYWVALVPAVFMSAVCSTFLLHAKECAINMNLSLATYLGVGFAGMCMVLFFIATSLSKSRKC